MSYSPFVHLHPLALVVTSQPNRSRCLQHEDFLREARSCSPNGVAIVAVPLVRTAGTAVDVDVAVQPGHVRDAERLASPGQPPVQLGSLRSLNTAGGGAAQHEVRGCGAAGRNRGQDVEPTKSPGDQKYST